MKKNIKNNNKKNKNTHQKAIDVIKDFKELKENITKKNFSKLFVYKKYNTKAKETVDVKKKLNRYNNYRNNGSGFDFIKLGYVLLTIFLIVGLVYSIVLVYRDYVERERLHVVSEKEYERFDDKEKMLLSAQEKLDFVDNNNLVLKSDNLNLAFVYNNVMDEEDKKYVGLNINNPEPTLLNDEVKETNLIDASVAGQVYKKLKLKNDMFIVNLQSMADTNPVNIVRKYDYSGYKILGNYNPKNSTHIKNKPVTYFIDRFTNVNIDFQDADGEKMDMYRNIQDIMSMGSIYTYFHDPYDAKTYLNYCYNLFDKSYTYVASISEVYYCSGCMDYADENIDNRTVTIKNIPESLYEQKQNNDVYEQKAGTLDRVDLSKIKINDYTYEQYKEDIKAYGHNRLHNYCPGHVDLDVTVICRCLNNVHGLTEIDNYGNSGKNYVETWHGWDKNMVNKATSLANKDWKNEYGLVVDEIEYLKPLPQELINYYMCTLPDDISQNRKILIQTALSSVSKIPYYYGGKPRATGYINNAFNTRKRPDYSGRVLEGLDCSGWITWVYWTAFNKKIVKGEGTTGLAKEGKRIVRTDLKAGDLIIRPGYDSHVMMFLSWAEDGKVKVIHENGSVNNVSIATYNAYYPYYRKIFSD